MRRGTRSTDASEDAHPKDKSRLDSSSASSRYGRGRPMDPSRRCSGGEGEGPSASASGSSSTSRGAGPSTGWASAAPTSVASDVFGGGSGWHWGTSGTWSPRVTPMTDNRSASSQMHVRAQSVNFDGNAPDSSLGQGLIGLRRSSVMDRGLYVSQGSESDDDAAIGLDPLCERAVTRHGLHLQPPPEIDKIDSFLDLMAFTNQDWSFGLLIAIGSQGLVQVSGQEWKASCPISQNAAFRRCCNQPNQNVVIESPGVDSRRGSGKMLRKNVRPSLMQTSQSADSRLDRLKQRSSSMYDEPETSAAGFPHLTSVFRAICLSPASDRKPVPVGMLFAFEQRYGARRAAEFGTIVDVMSQTVRAGLERNANVMRREKELLAQQSLISMKRFVSGELPSSTLGGDSGSLGMGIFSQAAMSIRAILEAHSCVIWDISCFRLFSSDSSSGSQSSDPVEGDVAHAANTWKQWNVRTSVQETDADMALESPHAERGVFERHASGTGDTSRIVAETVVTTVAEAADPSVAARASLGDAQNGDSEDSANSDGWTCSFPVTSQPVSIIGSSGGSMDHFQNLDGTVSRPLLAEFLATTKELGLSSRPQAEGEHIKTPEHSLFGEASSLANLVPSCCKGLIAVPVFETDDQPAFMILAAFEDTPVLEAADRHYVEQVGSILLTWSIRSRVERVDRAQTHFIQKIQHELRTPLHAVIGTLDVIKETLGERSSAESTGDAARQQQELVALVESASTSADALNNMINNVLDFGALKAMPVQPKQADDLPYFRWNEISAAISETCKSEWLSALQRGELCASTTPGTGCPIRDTPELLLDLDTSDLTGELIAAIDLEALQTVLRKLVNNAVRATSSGFVNVGLKISSRESLNDRKLRPGSRPRHKDNTYDIEVTVEDTGKGMQKDFIESHLFAPYAKEDTFLPGSGLSLAIASRLVHRMGGHITVASSPEVGTKFSITLPVRFGRSRSGASATCSAASMHRVSAYFAGFDTPALAKTKVILSRRHKLDEAENLADALIVFMPAEKLPSLEDVMMQLSQVCGKGRGPSQLVLLERADVAPSGRPLDQEILDALLRKYRLADDLQARKVPRPVGYKACIMIETVKERVLFPHQASRVCKSTMSISSDVSAAKSSNTRGTSESPSLSTPLSLDSKACPFELGCEAKSPATSESCQHASHPVADADNATSAGNACNDVRAATVEFAVEPATLQEVQVAADSMQPGKDFVVMVVEDNPLNMKIMTTMLDRAKINYIQAWNGREAVELFREHLPSVVLLDITMPIMDGFQACAEIRKIRPANLVREDGSPCHRIIAVTALSSEADRLRGREAGMDDWLKKPLKMSNLMNDLKAWKAQVTPV
ncbi:hypothetical protein ACQY0O_008112 [Thecaphora frezii]